MSATSSSTSSSLALSGLASGIDWTNIVNELLTVERAPEIQMKAQQSALQSKNTAYQGIGKQLTTLATDITTLSNPSFFDARTTTISNPAVASATAADSTPLGNYAFKINTLASDATQLGTTQAGQPLSATNNVAGVVLGSAGFATPVTAGTFTVNGKTITVATTDTLQSVFDQISTQTGGTVTAGYDSTTDEITFTGSGPITLGSGTDTSNFLQSAELFNNGGDSITSASSLGGVNLSRSLSQSNLATTIDDGGGAGKFLINGVEIDFNAGTDAMSDVLQRINDSSAGVTATYDSVNDRFELTSKTTGDVGITLQDTSGNFLAATGLSGGTLQRGSNLTYSINGGGTLTSQSNTIDATASGIPGLSVTALTTGTTTISINSDTTKISAAINSFVSDYNVAQTFIHTQTSPTTDANGNIVPAVLTGDMDTEDIADQLRKLSDANPAGLTGVIQSLADLGITSNGQDNSLSVSDPAALSNALANNLGAVKNLFTNSTNGLATSLNTYLTSTNGTNGVLASNENNNTKEITTITNSIASLESRISIDQTRLTDEFVAMETALNSINTQKQFLNQYFGGGNGSANAAPAAAGSGSTSSSSSG